jgi:hypothetical protein
MWQQIIIIAAIAVALAVIIKRAKKTVRGQAGCHCQGCSKAAGPDPCADLNPVDCRPGETDREDH